MREILCRGSMRKIGRIPHWIGIISRCERRLFKIVTEQPTPESQDSQHAPSVTSLCDELVKRDEDAAERCHSFNEEDEGWDTREGY